MLLARLAKTFETVIKLLGSIARRVEPGVLFDGGKVVYAAQTQNLFAAYFFQHFLLAVSIAYGFTQAFKFSLMNPSVI